MGAVWRFAVLSLAVTGCSSPELRGIDVSHHNGAIDWSQVAASGVRFAWLKASEGGDVVDARFSENFAGARRAGLAAGAYHFFTFCRPGDDQARNFLAAAPVTTGALAPVVDVEFVGNCRDAPTPSVIRGELERWLVLVEAAWGRRAIVYTTPDADELLLGGLARHRWLRSIGRRPSGTWAIWQREDSAEVPGIEGAVDVDVFRGKMHELEAL